jgi:hypothetical protein
MERNSGKVQSNKQVNICGILINILGKRRGILWNGYSEYLDYADDIVLLSLNFKDMQAKLDDLVREMPTYRPQNQRCKIQYSSVQYVIQC